MTSDTPKLKRLCYYRCTLCQLRYSDGWTRSTNEEIMETDPSNNFQTTYHECADGGIGISDPLGVGPLLPDEE